MKTWTVLVLLSLLLLLSGSASAQTPPAPPPPKSLWDFQKELGLTDDQVTQIKAAADDFKKLEAVDQQKYTALNQEYNSMVASGSDMDKLRKKLEELYSVQIEYRLANVVRDRKINSVMKPEQVQKWHEIQAKASQK